MAAVFSDVNANYSRGTNDLLEDIKAIENSLENIIGTSTGERFFLPEFGSDLLGIVHEPINEETADDVYDALISAIDRWEPRVQVRLRRSSVRADPDRNLYEVLIVYAIRRLGVESSLRRDILLPQG